MFFSLSLCCNEDSVDSVVEEKTSPFFFADNLYFIPYAHCQTVSFQLWVTLPASFDYKRGIHTLSSLLYAPLESSHELQTQQGHSIYDQLAREGGSCQLILQPGFACFSFEVARSRLDKLVSILYLFAQPGRQLDDSGFKSHFSAFSAQLEKRDFSSSFLFLNALLGGSHFLNNERVSSFSYRDAKIESQSDGDDLPLQGAGYFTVVSGSLLPENIKKFLPVLSLFSRLGIVREKIDSGFFNRDISESRATHRYRKESGLVFLPVDEKNYNFGMFLTTKRVSQEEYLKNWLLFKLLKSLLHAPSIDRKIPDTVFFTSLFRGRSLPGIQFSSSREKVVADFNRLISFLKDPIKDSAVYRQSKSNLLEKFKVASNSPSQMSLIFGRLHLAGNYSVFKNVETALKALGESTFRSYCKKWVDADSGKKFITCYRQDLENLQAYSFVGSDDSSLPKTPRVIVHHQPSKTLSTIAVRIPYTRLLYSDPRWVRFVLGNFFIHCFRQNGLKFRHRFLPSALVLYLSLDSNKALESIIHKVTTALIQTAEKRVREHYLGNIRANPGFFSSPLLQGEKAYLDYFTRGDRFYQDLDQMIQKIQFSFAGKVFLLDIFSIFQNKSRLPVLLDSMRKRSPIESVSGKLPGYSSIRCSTIKEFFLLEMLTLTLRQQSEGRSLAGTLYRDGQFYLRTESPLRSHFFTKPSSSQYMGLKKMSEGEFNALKYRYLGLFPRLQTTLLQYQLFLNRLNQVPGLQSVDFDSVLEKLSYEDYIAFLPALSTLK